MKFILSYNKFGNGIPFSNKFKMMNHNVSPFVQLFFSLPLFFETRKRKDNNINVEKMTLCDSKIKDFKNSLL